MQSSQYHELTFDNKRDLLIELRERLIKRIVSEKLPISRADDRKTVDLSERKDPFPLTEMQESFMVSRFLTRSGDYVGCHIYLEFVLPEVDVNRLKRAWLAVLERHSMLSVQILGTGTQQIVETPALNDFIVHEESSQAQFMTLRNELFNRVYETDQWPLFDIQLTRHKDKRYTVHFSIDEWIADGPSVSILLEDWYQAYHQKNPALRQLSSNFREYQELSRARFSEKKLSADLAYWRNELGEIEKTYKSNLLLHTVHEHRLQRSRYTRVIDADKWQAIKRKCKNYDVSPTTFLLTIYSYVLYSMEGKVNLPLPVTVSNRFPLVPDVNQLVGPFMSTMLFLGCIDNENKLIPLLKKNQARIWKDLDHNSVSGIQVLREMKAAKTIDRNFNIPFVFTSMIGNFNKNPDTWFANRSFFSTQTPQVFMDNQVYEDRGNLILNWDIADAAFVEGVIDRLINIYLGSIQLLAKESLSWTNATMENLIA